MAASTNVRLMKEIMKECAVFAKKVYAILSDHDDEMGVIPLHGKGDDSMPRKRKRKKTSRADGAPKKPLTAYMLFVKNERQNICNMNPEASFTDVGKLLGERWGKMSPLEKKKYDDMAAQDKLRYSGELADFNSGMHHAAIAQPIAGDESSSDDDDEKRKKAKKRK